MFISSPQALTENDPVRKNLLLQNGSPPARRGITRFDRQIERCIKRTLANSAYPDMLSRELFLFTACIVYKSQHNPSHHIDIERKTDLFFRSVVQRIATSQILHPIYECARFSERRFMLIGHMMVTICDIATVYNRHTPFHNIQHSLRVGIGAWELTNNLLQFVAGLKHDLVTLYNKEFSSLARNPGAEEDCTEGACAKAALEDLEAIMWMSSDEKQIVSKSILGTVPRFDPELQTIVNGSTKHPVENALKNPLDLCREILQTWAVPLADLESSLIYDDWATEESDGLFFEFHPVKGLCLEKALSENQLNENSISTFIDYTRHLQDQIEFAKKQRARINQTKQLLINLKEKLIHQATSKKNQEALCALTPFIIRFNNRYYSENGRVSMKGVEAASQRYNTLFEQFCQRKPSQDAPVNRVNLECAIWKYCTPPKKGTLYMNAVREWYRNVLKRLGTSKLPSLDDLQRFKERAANPTAYRR